MKTGAKIRAVRKQRGLTIEQVENMIGMSNGNLSRIERGEQWFPEQTLFDLARALNVNPAEFFLDGGTNFDVPMDRGGMLPVISWVQAGMWSEICDNFEPGDADEWVHCPFKHGPRSFILRVVGESMYDPDGERSYRDGDFIAVDPDKPAENKSRVVIRLDEDKTATFKQLVIDPDGTRYLVALNRSWPNRIMKVEQDATICGVVVGKWTPE